jgi:DNA-binding transcriptional LysR family regulator
MQRIDTFMRQAHAWEMDALSADQLRAFEAVARAGSFTRAAAAMHLSQPALSRRVSALEDQLETPLLVRARSGATLTEAGRRVFAFVEGQRALEEDLLGELAPAAGAHRGLIHIAGLSSMVPRVVLPALAPFLRANPAVKVELHSMEFEQVTAALSSGAVDLAVSGRATDLAGIVDVPLGDEEHVLVERRGQPGPLDVFLDTSPRDVTTEWFLAAQPARIRPARWTRSFLHDEAGILLGVELGIGRAIKPRHTIPPGSPVRVSRAFAPLWRPVYLKIRRQRVYGRLFAAVRERVEAAVRAVLRPPRR